jgi:hypothetical protein
VSTFGVSARDFLMRVGYSWRRSTLRKRVMGRGMWRPLTVRCSGSVPLVAVRLGGLQFVLHIDIGIKGDFHEETDL